MGLPKLGSCSQHDDGDAGKLAKCWVESLGRRRRDTSSRVRRSDGGDSKKTVHEIERESQEGKWRCPRHRGRRGDLVDASGADKRDQRQHTDDRVQTRGGTGEPLPTDAALI